MKRNLIGFLTALILFSLTSCLKKGKEDPALSFHSRKGRVVGNWHVDHGSVSQGDFSFSESYSISGNTYHYQGPSGYADGTANVVFKFERSGEAHISINLGGFVSVYNGSWNFSDGIGEKKKKTEIIMHPTDYTSSSGVQTIAGNQYDLTYEILELKNKEMKLHLSYKRTDPTGNYYAYDESWTLIQ